ncbi:DMT family transporter [Veillonella montpellierensis]|uniref:DMT family transporter n=1 Tax=Veillonella montpellierensis TaxID=187328 RepID=UPI0023F6BA76|nr:DMT family transporter [Veillonella montpellierensis]
MWILSKIPSTWIGFILTLLGGMLWGLSGTSVQFIHAYRHVDLQWLVTVRLLVAGLITLAWGVYREPQQIKDLLRHPQDMKKTAIFSIFGISMCQYAYFRAIGAAGVGIATVIQYLGPTLIIIYLLIRYRAIPRRSEMISVILAFLGTLSIVFHNGFTLVALNVSVVLWGLLSAVGIAVYSVQPISILQRYGTSTIMGMAMLIGSLAAYLLFRPTGPGGEWDMMTYLAVWGGIVGLGTIVSFNAYMEGIRRIGPVKGSILSSVEPISAALLGWWLLGNTFTILDMVGFVCILSTVFILAIVNQ